ncbi:MAG: hypothetical protein IK096_05265, partial [Lachnospiraceae bacterium]|nr:hypothetical protein [Lachnospiraceae bacterium]
MGLFDRFHSDKKKEAAEKDEIRRAEEERAAIAERQRKEHEKLSWPIIRPLSPVRVRDESGNERIPAIL